MRQTSQAVLMLLGAAQGGATAPGFSNVATAIGATTLADQGKWIGYAGKAVYRNIAAASLADQTIAVQGAGNNAAGQTANGTTSCIQCIKGAVTGAGNNRTVWCSAGWNYEYTQLLRAKPYPLVKDGADANTPGTWSVTGTGDGTTALKTGDLGACCYKLSDILTMGAVAQNVAAGGTELKLDLFNKWTCPAKYTSSRAAATALAANKANLVHSTKNWWCSDGSYSLAVVTDDTYATNGATATWNEKARQDNATTASTPFYAVANLLIDAATKDRREEILFAQCRQKLQICGGSTIVAEGGTAAQMKRVISNDDTGGFSADEKCTFVLRSKTKAPTFVISNTTAAKQLPKTVDVVYQEFIDGWQLTAGIDFTTGYKTDGSTAYNQGGVPNFAMATAKYAKAFKFNYPSATMVGSPWEAASGNNAQSPGEAWVYQSNGAGCTPDYSAASDKDGGGTTARASCFALAKKRWISLDTSGPTYWNAVADNYSSALSTFNTNAASYNTYLADLKTANEKDAFSAFFSPPKKPAMVLRPGAPTTPSAYTGLQHWPVASQTSLLKGTSGKATVPTLDGKQFVLGNNLFGGWGAWTSSLFVNNAAASAAAEDLSKYPISHSFGMLGTSQGLTATDFKTNMSYVKNWQKDNTTGARTAAQLKASVNVPTDGGGVMCLADATAGSHNCVLSKTGTSGAKNARYVYLNVSVWANAALAASAYTSDAYIQFYASSWADGKAYYAPAAAAAGTALSSPAGAQALAASAAAVVAVAAALY